MLIIVVFSNSVRVLAGLLLSCDWGKLTFETGFEKLLKNGEYFQTGFKSHSGYWLAKQLLKPVWKYSEFPMIFRNRFQKKCTINYEYFETGFKSQKNSGNIKVASRAIFLTRFGFRHRFGCSNKTSFKKNG